MEWQHTCNDSRNLLQQPRERLGLLANGRFGAVFIHLGLLQSTNHCYELDNSLHRQWKRNIYLEHDRLLQRAEQLMKLTTTHL